MADIGSDTGYPYGNLSNFHPYAFEVDGVKCASMEGFLQSLKFSNPLMQEHVCTLVGRQAKFKGKKKNWRVTQTLYWKGEEINRHSEAYQKLLDMAYEALACNKSFCKTLLATGDAVLTHSIGKSSESDTVLTTREFCRRLMSIRERLKNGKS